MSPEENAPRIIHDVIQVLPNIDVPKGGENSLHLGHLSNQAYLSYSIIAAENIFCLPDPPPLPPVYSLLTPW